MLTEARLIEQNRVLREENEELKETVRQLRADLAPHIYPLPEWVPHMTPMERQILVMLIERDVVTPVAMRNAIHDGEERVNNLLSVIVHRLRAKLLKFNVVILNVRGIGYRMTDRSKMRFAMQEANAA